MRLTMGHHVLLTLIEVLGGSTMLPLLIAAFIVCLAVAGHLTYRAAAEKRRAMHPPDQRRYGKRKAPAALFMQNPTHSSRSNTVA